MTESIAGPDECPFNKAAEAERKQILDACSDTLRPRQVLLLRLRYVEDLSFPKIAVRMHIAVQSAYNLHARALPALRAELQKRKIDHLWDLL